LRPISCEIDFPALPTLSTDERLSVRFSAPLRVYVAHAITDVPSVLRDVWVAQARGHWCVGFVAYEAASAFDAALISKPTTEVDAARPLAWFAEFDAPQVVTGEAAGRNAFHVGKWQSDTSEAMFAEKVESIRRDIREGRFYQVNYTTTLSASFDGDAKAFYRALQAAQPNGYHAFIDTGEATLLSVSPELFFSLRDGVVTTQPMKGTAPRGDTASEDAAFADYLTHSEKERAENLMIVDLLRNDLSRIAKPNSVEVPHLFSLHALPSVWQMTSTIRATLRDEVDLHEIFSALFPCGSITGAPKVEAMKAIRELELAPRGAYCGAIGYVAPNGVACFNVGIRSVWIEGERATCGVGSGITYDSTPEGESAELQYKARFVRRASKPFSLFETIRLEEGAFWMIERHLDRMEKSARHFRFQWQRVAAMSELDALKRQYPRGVWRIRLTSDRQGVTSAEAFAMPETPALPMFRLASSPVSSADEFLQHKTTRREVYELHAPPTDSAFDTLLYNERGELTEFTRANLVIDYRGERLTPPLTSGLLNGTLRDELIALGDVREAVLTQQHLAGADRIWWVNGLRGEVEVFLQTLRDEV
jgi:para-aminobenzoate synthetase / 4-amino-4-deoxychorismate lyase